MGSGEERSKVLLYLPMSRETWLSRITFYVSRPGSKVHIGSGSVFTEPDCTEYNWRRAARLRRCLITCAVLMNVGKEAKRV